MVAHYTHTLSLNMMLSDTGACVNVCYVHSTSTLQNCSISTSWGLLELFFMPFCTFDDMGTGVYLMVNSCH